MKKIFLWCMVIAVAAMIFMFSHQSPDASTKTSHSLAHSVLSKVSSSYREMSPPQQRGVLDAVNGLVRKSAHYIEFFMLGVSVYALCREYALRHCRRTAMVLGVGYALSDELHQLFISGRSAELLDVMIDSAGVLCGVLAAAFLLAAWQRRKA